MELEDEQKSMRKSLLLAIASAAFAFLFSSCATIIGGAKYNAKIQVPNHPTATITVNGDYAGQGEANLLIKRRDADKLTVVVKEEGYESETTNYTRKKFRGWAFVGTLLGWTGVIEPGIPLPWGVVVDAATGAWWKPDETEAGVRKIDYDHFLYIINYGNKIEKKKAIENKNDELKDSSEKNGRKIVTKADKLRELKQLLDDGILTQEEYEVEKAKILSSEGE